MAVGDAHVFPGFLAPVLTLFFPKPPTTFSHMLLQRERQKYAIKKSHLNRGSNSQPPGHESDTLTTEPSGRGYQQSSSTHLSISSIDGFLCSFLLLNLLFQKFDMPFHGLSMFHDPTFILYLLTLCFWACFTYTENRRIYTTQNLLRITFF